MAVKPTRYCTCLQLCGKTALQLQENKKRGNTELPDKEAFEKVYRIAALLHETEATDGYRKFSFTSQCPSYPFYPYLLKTMSVQPY